MLQELVSLVDRLKKRIQDYQKELQSSEALTRYVLIDPLLRALGWDTENPELVRPEVSTQAGRPDYALLHGGQKLAFIGAKALGKQEDLLQQISYCVSEGVRYFIATDGSRWEVYDTNIQKPLQDKKIVEWDIQSMNAGEVIRRAFTIMRYAGITEAAPPQIEPPKTTQPLHGTPLTRISQKPGDTLRYKKIIFPDGKSHPLRSWKDILTSTVEWLNATNKLTNLPIKTSRGDSYLVNTHPEHEDGKKFRFSKKVGSVYVETHFSARDILRHTRRLLEICGVKPDVVFLA